MDLLALFDIPAGILLLIGETWMPGWLQIIAGLFVIFRGVTALKGIKIWTGPISFFAGIVDIVAGSALYFSPYFEGVFIHFAQIFGVVLGIKGLTTVFYGIFNH